jgi:cellulose synthase/poly-beta-1,6-N-acetylglucosamine synthase-like glycosyltransferase
MDYCLDLAAPAELPGHINAFKSQQRRWATGSIQVAVKLLPRIWRARLRLGQKVEATLHLTHYTVSLWMLILALLARPMLFITLDGSRVGDWFWLMWSIVFISAVAPATTYGYARYILGGGLTGVPVVPQMMVLGCGMCLNNALAVMRGLKLRGGEFIRTPKSGTQRTARRRGSYKPLQSHLWIFELVLGVWTLFALAYYLLFTKWIVSVFMLLYGTGFLTIGWLSRPARRADRPGTPAEPAGVPASIPVSRAVPHTSHS